MTPHEAQARIDHLEGVLRRRDKAEAEAKAAALAAKNATDNAADAAARVAAAIAERETIRRGAWASHLIASANPAAALDFVALEKSIPVDGSWPPNMPAEKFVFTGGTVPPPVDIATTRLGKLLGGTNGR